MSSAIPAGSSRSLQPPPNFSFLQDIQHIYLQRMAADPHPSYTSSK